MSTLIAKEESTRIASIEPGTYPAICTAVIDLGMQYSQTYGKESHQIIIMFEIPSETIMIDDKERSRMVSITCTMSLGEKSNLRKMLESWRSRKFTEEELKGFDLEKVIGLPCLVNIINESSANGNTYSKIGSVSKMPKGMPTPAGREEQYLFELTDYSCIPMLNSLPNWIQERIRKSSTYEKIIEDGPRQDDAVEFAPMPSDDDLPF